MSPKKRKLKIDLVIPVFNEEGVLEKIHAQICAVVDRLSHEFHFIYVDDGSDDKSVDSLLRLSKSDTRVTFFSLSSNFGHQAALTAGIDLASGDVVISMDADGQHPPEMIPRLYRQAQKTGADVVMGSRLAPGGDASSLGFTRTVISYAFQ